jgi:hypothetical protein
MQFGYVEFPIQSELSLNVLQMIDSMWAYLLNEDVFLTAIPDAPLPCAEVLWDAGSAKQWREVIGFAECKDDPHHDSSYHVLTCHSNIVVEVRYREHICAPRSPFHPWRIQSHLTHPWNVSSYVAHKTCSEECLKLVFGRCHPRTYAIDTLVDLASNTIILPQVERSYL